MYILPHMSFVFTGAELGEVASFWRHRHGLQFPRTHTGINACMLAGISESSISVFCMRIGIFFI
jgi:hypothetical protein